MKILVIVPTFNRWPIARRCLENLNAMVAPQDEIVIFDDCSTEFDHMTLRLFSATALRPKQRIGIDAQRRAHFGYAADRFRSDPSFTHLYLTDSDALHDPNWRDALLTLQERYDGRAICGYNTLAHSCLEGNTYRDDPSEPVIWRKYAPGISMLFTADHVATIAPRTNTLVHWDWNCCELLCHEVLTTRTSYVEHVGVSGLHHPSDAGVEGGDRATNPTDFLVRKRAEVIAELRHDGFGSEAD